MSNAILSKFACGGEANFYGPAKNAAGIGQRSFASTLGRLARAGIAASVLVNLVVPPAAAEQSRAVSMEKAVGWVQAQVDTGRSVARLEAAGMAACYLVRTTVAQHGDGTSPDPNIEDSSIPKVFYIRVRGCEMAEESYARNRALFEKQAHMALNAPDLDLRKVDAKADMLGIDLQKPMSREEAVALRDSQNARVVELLDSGKWYAASEEVDHDGVHLSMNFQPR